MQSNPNAMLLNLVPLIFMFGVFYFLLIRPQQKKQKEHQKMLNELKKNDEIVTAGGILGTIVNVKEKTFVIRIDENCKMEIEKNAVSYVIPRKE